MRTLELGEHPRARGILCDVDHAGVSRVKEDAGLTLARVAALLGIKPDEVHELHRKGALKGEEDENGRPVIAGAELHHFVDKLRPVAFEEVEAGDEAGAEQDGEPDTPPAGRRRNPRAIAVPSPAAGQADQSDEDQSDEEEGDEDAEDDVPVLLVPWHRLKALLRGIAYQEPGAGDDDRADEQAEPTAAPAKAATVTATVTATPAPPASAAAVPGGRQRNPRVLPARRRR